VAEGRNIELLVVDDEESAARVVAERLAAAARAGGHVCLTGGSTPKLAYALAAELEQDWSRVELWWGDERCAPADDELTNYHIARPLVEHVSVPPAAVHRMRGELGPDAGALQYEEELGDLQRFDLMLLGLGPDGHLASLYPNQPTLDETKRRAIGAEAKYQPFVDRITLTLPMLRAADEVLFLVAGEEKADAAYRAFAAEPSKATPGSLVRSDVGRSIAVLDAAAASKL